MGSDLTPLNVPSSLSAMQVVRFWSLGFNDYNLADLEDFGFYEFGQEKIGLNHISFLVMGFTITQYGWNTIWH